VRQPRKKRERSPSRRQDLLVADVDAQARRPERFEAGYLLHRGFSYTASVSAPWHRASVAASWLAAGFRSWNAEPSLLSPTAEQRQRNPGTRGKSAARFALRHRARVRCGAPRDEFKSRAALSRYLQRTPARLFNSPRFP